MNIWTLKCKKNRRREKYTNSQSGRRDQRLIKATTTLVCIRIIQICDGCRVSGAGWQLDDRLHRSQHHLVLSHPQGLPSLRRARPATGDFLSRDWFSKKYFSRHHWKERSQSFISILHQHLWISVQWSSRWGSWPKHSPRGGDDSNSSDRDSRVAAPTVTYI